MTVGVALSGGVDSAVAALRVAGAGHRAVGLHMHLYDVCKGLAPDMTRSCCSPDDALAARRVAATLGIPFHLVDLAGRFHAEVVEPFGRAYAAGRTPNPCIGCNPAIKFGALWDAAAALGCEAIATGHYARVVERDGRPVLARPRDLGKDQTYFLYALSAGQLARALFPLADLAKAEVRAAAREAGLPVHEKPESQEVCFVAGEPYWAWLARRGYVTDPDPGDVVDTGGRVLGRHGGVHRYTVGQRQGLGPLPGGPWYVVALDPAARRVVVGRRADLLSRGAVVGTCRFPSGAAPAGPFEADVRVRYRDRGRRAVVTGRPDGRLEVAFAQPVAAVAPGQSAVFYDGDAVIGGGILEESRP